MPFIDLAPPSWEAVDDVATTLYATKEVAAGTVVTLAEVAIVSYALGTEVKIETVWIVL
jgi:hypothetical protein